MIKSVNDVSIHEAAEIIKSGGLVGMPTETVYGLAANALDGAAVAKIYEAKGRPSFNPLIIHVPDLPSAEALVEFNELAREAAAVFWPGPLTMILPRKASCGVSELASAGLETLAVRVPNHPAALALLRKAGVPIAAPSANKSGQISPTTPAHVAEGLGEAVDMIIAAGACKVGLESTVVDFSRGHPEILRPGGITAEDLSAALGLDIHYAHEQIDESAPKSPGMLLKHYAPNKPVRLRAVDLRADEALLGFGSLKFMGVLGGGPASDLPEDMRRNLSEGADLHEAASNLFAMLKALDKGPAESIAVMDIPNTGLGVAINDRLHRAAQRD